MKVALFCIVLLVVGCHGQTIADKIKQSLQEAKANIMERYRRVMEQTFGANEKIMETQLANDEAKMRQMKGELLQEATMVLIKTWGAAILGDVQNVDVDALADEVLTSARKRRSASSYDAAKPNCPDTAKNCANDVHKLYRSVTGKCNNLFNITMGSAVTPIRRFLNQAYFADGFNAVRSESAVHNGSLLPSPRLISNNLMAEALNPVFDAVVNHFHMQFGQFIAHDLVVMPSSVAQNGAALNCQACESLQVENCYPIPVPEDDTYFHGTDDNGKPRCIRFTRALNGQKGLGQRTPLNQNTHFLDLSVVYGSSECEARDVRSFTNGELNTLAYAHTLPPQDLNDTNCQSAPSFPCFKAGDFRNCLQPGLIPMHVIFINEHNRMAKIFTSIHPEWSDEKIFQETRRLNIAQYQHFVYSEYLPSLIGTSLMSQFGLLETTDGSRTQYNSSVNPSIMPEFSVAAFRFGHSQARKDYPRIDNNKLILGSPVDLGNNIFYTESNYEKLKTGTSALVEGLIQTPAMKVDNQFSFPMRNQIFEIRNKVGSGVDLIAVNIMRGRDVGLFPYTAYRERVGLKRANDFNGLKPEISAANIAKIKNVYAHVDDIDLYVAILSETLIPGASIGPTGGYLIAEQFSSLKQGDRFFYEHNVADSNSLTDKELAAVKKTRLAGMVCNNSAAMTLVNVDIFLLKSSRVACSTLSVLDPRDFA